MKKEWLLHVHEDRKEGNVREHREHGGHDVQVGDMKIDESRSLSPKQSFLSSAFMSISSSQFHET